MKVILITPYGGSNLGDAAIQESVIQALRTRAPAVEIGMASLVPSRTGRLHQVPSFPITALEVPYYSDGILDEFQPGPPAAAQAQPSADAGSAVTPEPVPAEPETAPAASGLKAIIRRVPWLFRFLRAGLHAARGAARFPRLAWREVRHFRAAREFSRGATLFLVSGGGQLDDYWGGPWGHPYSLVKWRLVARSMGARFVFLSIGVCAIESRASMRRFAYALRHADYRSYRDQTSKSLLAHLPFTRDDAVLPDLSFSFPHARATRPAGQGTTPMTVGISPIAYLRHNWPKQDVSAYHRYMTELEEFCAELLRRGHPLVLFSTDSPDRHPIRELEAALAGRPGLDAGRRVRSVLPATVDELFEVLADVETVVASRLHGILLAHLVQKPVLAISYDRKVDTHMQDLAQSSHCLDIDSAYAAQMLRGFDALVHDREAIRRDLALAQRRLAAALDGQYDRVLEG